MLTVEQCRAYLTDTALTDEQVEQLRDALYAVAQIVLASDFASHTDDAL